MEEPRIDDSVERSSQSPQVEGIGGDECCLDAALSRLLFGLLDGQGSRVDTPGLVSALRQVEHVFPGAAAYVQHRALDLARLFQPNKFRLGTANIPWRSAPIGGIEARLVSVTVRIGHKARERCTREPCPQHAQAA